jgi:hypothetical protein
MEPKAKTIPPNLNFPFKIRTEERIIIRKPKNVSILGGIKENTLTIGEKITLDFSLN